MHSQTEVKQKRNWRGDNRSRETEDSNNEVYFGAINQQNLPNAAVEKKFQHVRQKRIKEDQKSQNYKNADIELVLKEFDILDTVGRPRAVSDMLPTFQTRPERNKREMHIDDKDVLVTPRSNKN